MTKNKSFIPNSKQFYRSIVSVYCPILKDTVYFTSNGLHHLFYKTNRLPRKFSEIYLKLTYLKYVPKALQNCEKICEVRCMEIKVKNKIKKCFQYELYYEKSPKIKLGVLIQRIGTGKYAFLSIIPYRKKEHKKTP